MSLPQSNIDWTRYMEGLQGKANVDLANTTEKLSSTFLEKFEADWTAGISIPVPKGTETITIPASGYLQVFHNEYLALLFVNRQTATWENHFYNGSYGTGGNLAYIRVEKGLQIRKADYTKYTFAYLTLYPLKGAK